MTKKKSGKDSNFISPTFVWFVMTEKMASWHTLKYSFKEIYFIEHFTPFFLAFFTKENKLVGKRGDFESASQAPDLSSQTPGDTQTAYISERTALNPI